MSAIRATISIRVETDLVFQAICWSIPHRLISVVLSHSFGAGLKVRNELLHENNTTQSRLILFHIHPKWEHASCSQFLQEMETLQFKSIHNCELVHPKSFHQPSCVQTKLCVLCENSQLRMCVHCDNHCCQSLMHTAAMGRLVLFEESKE